MIGFRTFETPFEYFRMGRPRGSKNKTSPGKIVKVESPLQKKAVKDEKAVKPEVQLVAIPIREVLETPLFVCRRCKLAYETQDEYGQHLCEAQVYSVVEEDEQIELQDEIEGEIEEEKTIKSKKPRKPYKKREKKKPAEKPSKDPVKCPTCSKTFTRKYHLERHMVHTSCNPGTIERQEFSCEVCSKTFSRIDNLRMHLRAHLGQKSRSRDFQCPYCEKSFYGSSLLNIHVRTHTRRK